MSPAVRQVFDGLGGVLLFLVPGAAWVLLLPAIRHRRRPARAGYAWLLGVIWVAGSSWAASHVFGWQLRRGVILPVALLPVAAAIVISFSTSAATNRDGESTSRYSLSKKSPGVLPLLVFLFGCFITFGLFADVLTNPVNDWDGLMTWTATARFMRAERTVDAKVFQTERYLLSHPSYPPLMPVSQVALVEVLGTEDDERLPRLIYAGFFPALLLILFDGVRSLAGRTAASLGTLLASAMPAFYFYEFGGAFGNYSDFPLACFAGGGALLLFLERRLRSGGIAAGMLLAGAVLTKIEGTPIAILILAVSFLATALRRHGKSGEFGRFVPPLIAAGLVASALLLLLSWRAGISKRGTPSYMESLRQTSFPAALSNLMSSGREVAVRLVEVPLWGYFWIALPVLLVLGWKSVRRRFPLVMVGAFAPLLVMAAAYAVTPESYGLVNATAHRALIQAAVPIFFIVGVALRGGSGAKTPQAMTASS